MLLIIYLLENYLKFFIIFGYHLLKKMLEIVEYTRLIKNSRGVLLYNPKKGYDDRLLGWLMGKHRYRNIGIPPSIYSDRFAIKPFVKLFYPDEVVERLPQQLPDLPDYVSEALVFSLIFGCPLYILNQDIFKALEPVTIWRLKVSSLPTQDELLRNIRIAGYSIIDFYENMIENTHEVILQYLDNKVPISKLKVTVGKREDIAKKDGNKRFWRMSSLPEGLTVLAYFDLLRLFLNKPNLLKIFKESKQAPLLLGISCGVLIY